MACEQRIVSTRQGDTFVIISGDPSTLPVVLLHGSGTNAASWMGDVASWAQHHRVYAVDMIGEPGLSAPSRPPLASSAYAEWLDDVWAGLGLEKASVVGISLGGWLGLDFAIRRPKPMVEALLVVFRNFRPRTEHIPRFTDIDLGGRHRSSRRVVWYKGRLELQRNAPADLNTVEVMP